MGFLCSTALAAERIWLDASINGKPVRAALDTGASVSFLTPKAAARLGLKVKPPSFEEDLDKLLSGETEPCELQLLSITNHTKLGIVEFPSILLDDFDLVCSWNEIGDRIFQIDGEKATVKVLDQLPPGWATWTIFDLLASGSGNSTLGLKVPGQLWGILVDTGDPEGIGLIGGEWLEWKARHTNAPITLGASYSPSEGPHVSEQSFAREMNIGGLPLTEVPVQQSGLQNTGKRRMTFGMTALKRMDLIVDVKAGNAYARPKKNAARPYAHNRLGAVFIPRDLKSDKLSDELVAHVAPGSPAQTAGLQNGDVLLKIGQLEISSWRLTNSTETVGSHWKRPAGTRVELTVKRGERTNLISATLRDILVP